MAPQHGAKPCLHERRRQCHHVAAARRATFSLAQEAIVLSLAASEPPPGICVLAPSSCSQQ